MKTKVGVVSLGCDKNRVDTEVMLANLENGGYEITSDPSQADVIIVNTCAFLEAARKEAIETALEMSGLKKRGKCKKVIVTGCLGQKYGEELFSELKEVDAVVGAYEYGNICSIVEKTLQGDRSLYRDCSEGITFGKRVLTTAPHVAYLKIADGCDNFCTYCLIPKIRGKFRSVPMEQIVDHAAELAAHGVKELILVAQDTTKYGFDIYGEYKLAELLKNLSNLEGIEWIRLLYCYPELMSDELIGEIASNPKIVKYVDIPLQHVNDGILKKMNRRTDSKRISELFDKLETAGICVRSTFICGFPTETNDTIRELKDFLLRRKLRNVGFFAYSREEGTAAARMRGQIPELTKERYVKNMYKAQYKVCEQLNRDDIGKIYKCIVDECLGDNVYLCRTYFMTPEIDGVVNVYSYKKLNIGEFYDIKITNAREYDLEGELADEHSK